MGRKENRRGSDLWFKMENQGRGRYYTGNIINGKIKKAVISILNKKDRCEGSSIRCNGGKQGKDVVRGEGRL